MESGPVAAAVAALHTARAAVAAVDIDTLTHRELLELLDHLETDTRRTPTLAHRVINRLAAEANPLELGATSLTKLLAVPPTHRQRRRPQAHRQRRGPQPPPGTVR